MKNKKPTYYQLPTTSYQSGFTLIELLIGFAIIGLLAVLVAAAYFAHFKIFSNQSTSIEVASQNKIALDEITNQIRESQAVVNTCADCSGDTTSSTVLVLQIWPINASSEPFEPQASAYDFMVYKRDPTDNTKFIKKIIADAASSRQSSQKIIATNISDLQFTYDNPNPTLASEITINLTTTGISGGKTLTSAQSTKAVLRNK